MSRKLFTDTIFIKKLTEVTEANLTNNQFGVSELVRELGMSRSYVHRRLKILTNHSISHFICTVRLEKAMEMLRKNEGSAAEIAYCVGFSSPAYFSHCFHKHYGFPPGEVKTRLLPEDREENELAEESGVDSEHLQDDVRASIIIGKKFTRNRIFLMSAIILVVIALTWVFYFVFINDSFPPDDLNQLDNELSIVVLPFKNLTDNPNNQYFADGITEDILNNLYWITALRVVSRTSTEQYRESNLSAREIAREQDAKYVLEGSVRMYDEKTRISVQLIDAYRDEHVWSSYFDRDLIEIIHVQDEIAFQVASKLKAVLSEYEIRQIGKIPTHNPTAYDYYLHGRFLLHKANSEQRFDFNIKDVMNCIQYYENAISEDANFAEAYAGLANAYFNLSAWGWLPPNEGFPKAISLCLKALEIDPDCAEAHAVKGAYHVWVEREFKEGGKELTTSIQLNPNFSTARQWIAQYLMITGPIEDARYHIDRALELEPYFWVVQNLNAWIYYFEEKYDKAIEACLVARDLKPDFNDNEWLFVLNYAKLDEGENAVQMLQTIIKHYPEAEQYGDEIWEAYYKSGINGIFTWLVDVNKNKPIPVQGMNGHPFFIAWWNAILGNQEESVYWLDKNMENKERLYFFLDLIATNPDFDILRDDPRFLKIVDEIGLSPYHHRKTK